MAITIPTITGLAPGEPIQIIMPAGGTRGISTQETLNYTVTDTAYLPGDPPLNVTTILTIVETDKYTFEDGTVKKTQADVLNNGTTNNSFSFKLKNIYDMLPGSIVAVNLQLCSFETAAGEGTKRCGAKQYQVTL